MYKFSVWGFQDGFIIQMVMNHELSKLTVVGGYEYFVAVVKSRRIPGIREICNIFIGDYYQEWQMEIHLNVIVIMNSFSFLSISTSETSVTRVPSK